MDSPDTFFIAYDPSKAHDRGAHLERIGEQLATLCATLGEYPTIRYQSENERMTDLAQAVSTKLEKYKADDPSMGEVITHYFRFLSMTTYSRSMKRAVIKPNLFYFYLIEVSMLLHLYFMN